MEKELLLCEYHTRVRKVHKVKTSKGEKPLAELTDEELLEAMLQNELRENIEKINSNPNIYL